MGKKPEKRKVTVEEFIECYANTVISIYAQYVDFDALKDYWKVMIGLFTMPLWFFPATYYDYKRKYKYLKKEFANNGIDLTNDYQPEPEADNA